MAGEASPLTFWPLVGIDVALQHNAHSKPEYTAVHCIAVAAGVFADLTGGACRMNKKMRRRSFRA